MEFIDFVVPIARICAKYPGGWEACLRDHRHLIGKRVWYDDHLFRDGAMSPTGIEALVVEWEALGFQTSIEQDGRRAWNDVCVIESALGGPTLRCNWIEFHAERRIAYMTGIEPGSVVGRGNFDVPADA